jgi:hypothetical protein
LLLARTRKLLVQEKGLPDRFFFGRHCLGKTIAQNATYHPEMRHAQPTEQTTKIPACKVCSNLGCVGMKKTTFFGVILSAVAHVHMKAVVRPQN